jgi:tetratricopeptide (TPR) repeat protein
VRVSPELVETSTGATRWEQPFDAALTDVFRVQAEIAEQVAGALGLALGTRERGQLAGRPTTNLAAYDAFLRGEQLSGGMSAFDAPTLRNAAAQYEHAVALDSAFLPAWARLARARAFIFANGNGDPAAAEGARRAAERAGRLAPGSAEARLALGLYYGVVLKDKRRAVAEYEAGLRVARNDPDLLSFAGGTEALLGSWDSADVHLQRAQTLDPRSATTALVQANTLLAQRRYAEAAEASARVIALAPANPFGVGFAVLSHLGQGDSAAARAAIRAKPNELEERALVSVLGGWELGWLLSDAQLDLLLHLTPAHFDDDRVAWWATRAEAFRQRGNSVQARMCDDSTRAAAEAYLRGPPETRAGYRDAYLHKTLGVAYAHLGRAHEAIREGERATTLLPVAENAVEGPYFVAALAQIYIALGQPEPALDQLEYLMRIPFALSPAWIRIDPAFAPLRGNPRFERLVNGQ